MNERILTLVIKIDQDDRPSWIWHCHAMAEFQNGMQILAIAEGDRMFFHNVNQELQSAQIDYEF